MIGENIAGHLIAGLADQGWAHAGSALDPDLVTALRLRAMDLSRKNDLKEAGIGRGTEYRHNRAIRRTRIAWLDGQGEAEKAFLGGCEAFRQQMNRELYAGLQDFEAHFAIYPPGGHYARHLDAFAHPARPAGDSPVEGFRRPKTRVVSLVVYLNEHWKEGAGGELALWSQVPRMADGRADLAALDAEPPVAVITPRGGDIVVMLSADIPHEVRATKDRRVGIAGWWRIAPDTAELLGTTPALATLSDRS